MKKAFTPIQYKFLEWLINRNHLTLNWRLFAKQYLDDGVYDDGSVFQTQMNTLRNSYGELFLKETNEKI